MTLKCDDFEIAFENSDSECHSNDSIVSKSYVINDCKLCDICVYNREHAHHTWDSWKKYREEIGIPPK